MEDTKVEGTKIKKRSRNVKEVPNDRLRMMSRVLFPGRITLQIFRCYSFWASGFTGINLLSCGIKNVE